MEVKVNALVIKAIDYKDNDRVLTLYSLEKGKITAGIKGIKKAGAKLKFASEPFCFAEYVLAEKSGKFTVIGASCIDLFYELRLDIKKHYLSAVIIDFLNNNTESENPDLYLFDLAINTIKNICYNSNERAETANFLYRAIENSGYGFNDTVCRSCGSVIKNRVFFRYKDASFSCLACLEEGFSEIREETYNSLKLLLDNDFISLEKTESGVKMLINFLAYYLFVKTDLKLKSIDSLKEIDGA